MMMFSRIEPFTTRAAAAMHAEQTGDWLMATQQWMRAWLDTPIEQAELCAYALQRYLDTLPHPIRRPQ